MPLRGPHPSLHAGALNRAFLRSKDVFFHKQSVLMKVQKLIIVTLYFSSWQLVIPIVSVSAVFPPVQDTVQDPPSSLVVLPLSFPCIWNITRH